MNHLALALTNYGRSVCGPMCKMCMHFCAGDASHTEPRLEEMRALLAQRREHLPLWHAYGQQLYKSGQAKVIFHLSCCCLGAQLLAYMKQWPCPVAHILYSMQHRRCTAYL